MWIIWIKSTSTTFKATFFYQGWLSKSRGFFMIFSSGLCLEIYFSRGCICTDNFFRVGDWKNFLGNTFFQGIKSSRIQYSRGFMLWVKQSFCLGCIGFQKFGHSYPCMAKKRIAQQLHLYLSYYWTCSIKKVSSIQNLLKIDYCR